MSKTKNSFLIEASHSDSPIIGVIQDADLSKPESFKRILSIALEEHYCAESVSVSDPPAWAVDTHWPNFDIAFVVTEEGDGSKWNNVAHLSAICIYDNDYKND
jgi:hypothetical protein